MLTKTCACALLLLFAITFSLSQEVEFAFHGFTNSNLTLDGVSYINSNGLLRLTNKTDRMNGHAFYPSLVHFGGSTSFSTTFVFAIMSEYFDLSGHGLTFFISPTKNLSTALSGKYLGLFNTENNGNLTNHMFAVELDTIYTSEFHDINDNHIGIDINGLQSNQSDVAGYYADDSGAFRNLSLIGGQTMQVWVDYESQSTQINVTLSPIGMGKPIKPLLSCKFNLSTVLRDAMYIGFSASTGLFPSSHYILGWSFKLNGAAPSIDLSKLPMLPHTSPTSEPNVSTMVLPFGLSSFIVLIIIASILFYMMRRHKSAELLEDWEVEFGPHRFSYKDLHKATNGFNELLGSGGFGSVYRGVLPSSKFEVAVKRAHESRLGMEQFIAEIVSIGRLRHRNLVPLLGYSRREGELLLVYDYMPNGSLDRYLYGRDKPILNWAQRYKIIKGVASGLLYLHQEWDKVVVHRDIKASNVLLDSELNGRLGDFGLAILYDHDVDPQPTKVVGTMGYLAPELTRTGKATPLTDVYAFGAFMLVVICGRRPIEPREEGELMILTDLVLEYWEHESLADVVDPRLRESYVMEEIEMFLKLSLLCAHPLPDARPSMQRVMQYLEGTKPLPELSVIAYRNNCTLSEGYGSCVMSHASNMSSVFGLSGGR